MSTYIYNTEVDYYNEYRRSKFGLTWKKGGWDCTRHLEILANLCVPYFDKSTFENCGLDINDCPQYTLTHHRKDLYSKVLQYQSRDGTSNIPEEDYKMLLNVLYQHTIQHLTTRAMARYILTTITK
jgi:hypothetical protein